MPQHLHHNKSVDFRKLSATHRPNTINRTSVAPLVPKLLLGCRHLHLYQEGPQHHHHTHLKQHLATTLSSHRSYQTIKAWELRQATKLEPFENAAGCILVDEEKWKLLKLLRGTPTSASWLVLICLDRSLPGSSLSYHTTIDYQWWTQHGLWIVSIADCVVFTSSCRAVQLFNLIRLQLPPCSGDELLYEWSASTVGIQTICFLFIWACACPGFMCYYGQRSLLIRSKKHSHQWRQFSL